MWLCSSSCQKLQSISLLLEPGLACDLSWPGVCSGREVEPHLILGPRDPVCLYPPLEVLAQLFKQAQAGGGGWEVMCNRTQLSKELSGPAYCHTQYLVSPPRPAESPLDSADHRGINTAKCKTTYLWSSEQEWKLVFWVSEYRGDCYMAINYETIQTGLSIPSTLVGLNDIKLYQFTLYRIGL